MNINSLLNKMDLFDEIVIESGMQRDFQDYHKAIQQGQNRTIVFMQDISEKMIEHLENVYRFSLQDELTIALNDSDPFTNLNTINELSELDQETTIDAGQFFQRLNPLLTQIIAQIVENKTEIDTVREILSKYVDSDPVETDANKALVSLVFKDEKTTGGLLEFSKVLGRWNRTLLIFHGLIKSESPEEINLSEVQNGSIDVIFNIDFDVAIDLTELIKTGFQVYGAYLLYKSEKAKEIIASYMGNKKLIASEKEREKLMLENIKDSLKSKLFRLHKERQKSDSSIDGTSQKVRIEEVCSIITDHIVKGNELKLITPPETEEGEDDISQELKKVTAIAQERFQKLSTKDQKLLMDAYSIKEEDDDE